MPVCFLQLKNKRATGMEQKATSQVNCKILLVFHSAAQGFLLQINGRLPNICMSPG